MHRILILAFLGAALVALTVAFAGPDFPSGHSRALTSIVPEESNLVSVPSAPATPSEDQGLVGMSAWTSLFSLPAPFVIQSHLPSLLLFEIFTETAFEDETYTEEPSLFPDLLFKIVFRLIISPNAP